MEEDFNNSDERGERDSSSDSRNLTCGEGDSSSETANQPCGEGESSSETVNQPCGEGDSSSEPANQPWGEGVRSSEPVNQPRGEGDSSSEPANQPRGEGVGSSEPVNQPRGERDSSSVPVNQPCGENREAMNLTCGAALQDYYFEKTHETLDQIFDRYVEQNRLPSDTNIGTFRCKMVTVKKQHDLLRKSKKKSEEHLRRFSDFLESDFPTGVKQIRKITLTELVDDLRKDKLSLEDLNANNNKIITDLKTKLDACNETLINTNKILEDCCKDNYDLENKLENVQSSLVSKTELINDIRTEIAEKDNLIEKLEVENINLREKLNHSSDEIETLKTKYNESCDNIKRTELTSLKYKVSMKKKKAESSAAKSKLARTKNTMKRKLFEAEQESKDEPDIKIRKKLKTPEKLKILTPTVSSTLLKIKRQLKTKHLRNAYQVSRINTTARRIQEESKIMVQFSQSRQNDSVSKAELFRRGQDLFECAKLLSGLDVEKEQSRESIEQNVEPIFESLIKSHPNLFGKLLQKQAIFELTFKLSAMETLAFLRQLKLSGPSAEKLKSFLLRRNLDFLAPSKNVKAEKKKIQDAMEMESGKVTLLKDTKADSPSVECPYAKVTSLKNMVHKVLESEYVLENKVEDLLVVKDAHVLLLSGDKGGNLETDANSMKFLFAPVRKNSPQSKNSLTLYAAYQGSDIAENLAIFHGCYTHDLDLLQVEKSPAGRKLLICAQGDGEHQDATTGHQSSSATFPSAFRTVPLDHLQNFHKEGPGASIPHNSNSPECNLEAFPLRTPEQNRMQYLENQADPRNNNNLRKNGKHHLSIIGPMLVNPVYTNSILQFGISPLHIMLGVHLKEYELFFLDLKQLDAVNNQFQDSRIAEMERLELDIFLNTMELEETNAQLNLVAKETILMENLLERIKCAAEDDHAKNIALAKVMNGNSIDRREEANWKCSSQVCICTPYDKNVVWLSCSIGEKCKLDSNSNTQGWLHNICEVVMQSEMLALKLVDENGEPVEASVYKCRQCENKIESNADMLEFGEKLHQEKKSENEVHDLFVKKKELIAKLKSLENESEAIEGPLVKKHKQVLEQVLKIRRQAFHSSVFVGNHMETFLKNHTAIVDVFPETESGMIVKWNDIFGTLNQIGKRLLCIEPATPEEISTFQLNVNSYGDLLLKYHSDISITPKQDTLLMVAPESLKFWEGHSGTLCEQSTEAIHNITNGEARLVFNIRNPAERLKYLCRVQEINKKCSYLATDVEPNPRWFICPCCQKMFTGRDCQEEGCDYTRNYVCNTCSKISYGKICCHCKTPRDLNALT